MIGYLSEAVAVFLLGCWWGSRHGVPFERAWHRGWWAFRFHVLKDKAKEWRW